MLRQAAFFPNSHPTGNCMRSFSTAQFLAQFFLGAALFSILCGPQSASAQLTVAPARPPAAAAPPPAVRTPPPAHHQVAPAGPPAPAAKPAAAPALRGGASCHDGMTFDRFLG